MTKSVSTTLPKYLIERDTKSRDHYFILIPAICALVAGILGFARVIPSYSPAISGGLVAVGGGFLIIAPLIYLDRKNSKEGVLSVDESAFKKAPFTEEIPVEVNPESMKRSAFYNRLWSTVQVLIPLALVTLSILGFAEVVNFPMGGRVSWLIVGTISTGITLYTLYHAQKRYERLSKLKN